MDDYAAWLTLLEYGRMLSLKFFALAIALAFGLWRVHRRAQGHEAGRDAGAEREFDMRRDGQHFTA